MREMVLNHASVRTRRATPQAVIGWLSELAKGIAVLIREHVVQSSLRMAYPPSETPCLPDRSLFDMILSLRSQGKQEEFRLLMQLTEKVPLLDRVGEDTKNRFLGCEEMTLPPLDGEPLVFCVIVGGVSVGFPTDSKWNCDRLRVRFTELLPDGTLLFGPDVEDNLKACASVFPTIVGKLVDLDSAAREWRSTGGPAPRWRTHVSPESVEKMKVARFRTQRGNSDLISGAMKSLSGMPASAAAGGFICGSMPIPDKSKSGTSTRICLSRCSAQSYCAFRELQQHHAVWFNADRIPKYNVRHKGSGTGMTCQTGIGPRIRPVPKVIEMPRNGQAGTPARSVQERCKGPHHQLPRRSIFAL